MTSECIKFELCSTIALNDWFHVHSKLCSLFKAKKRLMWTESVSFLGNAVPCRKPLCFCYSKYPWERQLWRHSYCFLADSSLREVPRPAKIALLWILHGIQNASMLCALKDWVHQQDRVLFQNIISKLCIFIYYRTLVYVDVQYNLLCVLTITLVKYWV